MIHKTLGSDTVEFAAVACFPRRITIARGTVVLAVCLLLAGCQLTQPPLVNSPLSYTEQEQAVLKIVPLGTPREEVRDRLSAAGIDGQFGISDSVYYCDTWKRSDGAHWHVNVALLFDQSGILYKTRPAQSETGVLSDSAAPSATTPNADVRSQRLGNQSVRSRN